MIDRLKNKEAKLAVIGLGYVGLPIALEFAKIFKVVGFDINEERVEMMKNGIDPSKELEPHEFEDKDILFSANVDDLKDCNFYIVAVPTPVDKHKVPNLVPLQKSSESIGKVIGKGDYVVYESTVYPGCTEEDCIPIIEEHSGLERTKDFMFGYSPERINPGDKVNTITKITKVVSGCCAKSADVIEQVYAMIIEAGVFRASSVKVAEAAKIIENTQRDLNIALMNELSLIFDRIGIDTVDVLDAAATKWNFIKFYPGLVGGHCIGVDPYYLTYKAISMGYEPDVILAGRRINDEMSSYVGKKTVQLIIKAGKFLTQAKVLVMGVTFKEDVSDIRNSKVADLIKEINSFSISVHSADPHAKSEETQQHYGFDLVENIDNDYDAVIVAVSHEEYLNLDEDYFKSIMSENGILIDVKSLYKNKIKDLTYWTL